MRGIETAKLQTARHLHVGHGVSRAWLRRFSGSSLRTQGPINPGLKSEKRLLLQHRNENPRRMGPCVRRDDPLRTLCETDRNQRTELLAICIIEPICMMG